jgi:hypothetical protein
MSDATYVDGVLKEWGDRVFYGVVKGRKGASPKDVRNLAGRGVRRSSGRLAARDPRATLRALARMAPEVMVKISGGGKNMGRINAHLDYISRNGKLGLEDQDGDLIEGRGELLDLRREWQDTGYRIGANGERRREAFNIVLSMPPGTRPDGVLNAARAFAHDVFDGHRYVFVAHNDEKHPHVHLAVKAVSDAGVRLNPRKADLQRWREAFAARLVDQGIDASATARPARGIVRKNQRQAVRHIDKDYQAGGREWPSRATAGQLQDAAEELRSGKPRANPAHEAIDKRQKETLQGYAAIARALAQSDANDRALAVATVGIVRQMEGKGAGGATRHSVLLEQLRRRNAGGASHDSGARSQGDTNVEQNAPAQPAPGKDRQ